MALHDTNVLNVEATLYAWASTQLNALPKPSWLPSFTIVNDMPEQGITTPSVSLMFLGNDVQYRWQGNHTGAGERGGAAFGLLDVSCWVSRGDTVSGQQVWAAQLRTLRAFVIEVFAGAKTQVIQDYLTDPASPSATAYVVRMGSLDSQSVAPDPNPDIQRARFLIRYDWIVRGANS